MNLLVLLFLITMLAVTAILTFFNIDPVSITLWTDYEYDLPKIALILIPFAVGAVFVFFLYVVRDAKKYINSWKDSKARKKESRIQDLYSKGTNAVLAGQSNDARDYFKKILNEAPGHPYALMRLGNLALQADNLNEAIDYFKKSRDNDPKNLEILFALAHGFKTAGKVEETMGILDEILRLDDGNLAALTEKRSLYERLDRWDEVNEIQQRVLKLQSDPKEKEIEQSNLLGYKYEIGRYYLEGGKLEKAIKAFKAVLKLEKNFVPGYLGEAEALLRQENADKSVEILEKGYEITDSLTILIRLEDLFLSLGNPNRIIALYQKALESDPSNPKIQFFLGKLYYRLEMLDDAFEILSKLDTVEDHYPDRHKLLGSIYLRRGNPEQAAEEFKKAMHLRRRIVVPYCCSECGHQDNEWSGRCSKCGRWDTFTLDLSYKTCTD